MRLLIDAIGAPYKSGGMQVWARQLLQTWVSEFPGDELVVVGSPQVFSKISAPNLRFVNFLGRSAASRAMGQQVLVPLVAVRHHVDGLLSLNSVLSYFLTSLPSVVINHDWRHMRNPREFSLPQRLYRRMWVFGTRASSRVVAVSEKTARETKLYTGRSDVEVVTPGGNHLIGDVSGSVDQNTLRAPFLLTFAHHTNKKPELVLRALAHLVQQRLPESSLSLVVLGARKKKLNELIELCAQLRIAELVDFRDYVSDAEYGWLVQKCAAICLVSTDEGFGIPIAEALFSGKPIVVSEIVAREFPNQSLVFSAEMTEEALAESILNALSYQSPIPQNHFSWATTTRRIRTLFLEDKNE